MTEVAEAVHTTTDLVMAVANDGVCLYTPEGTEEIWRCQIGRDGDGIVVAGPGKFVATFDEFQAEIEKFMEKAKNIVVDDDE